MSASHPIFYRTFQDHLQPVQNLPQANLELVKVREAKNWTLLHVAASCG